MIENINISNQQIFDKLEKQIIQISDYVNNNLEKEYYIYSVKKGSTIPF